jgi:hypothetical protein
MGSIPHLSCCADTSPKEKQDQTSDAKSIVNKTLESLQSARQEDNRQPEIIVPSRKYTQRKKMVPIRNESSSISAATPVSTIS